MLSAYLTAYRKRSGCETSLLKSIEDWKVPLEKKKNVALCVTVISKAFDSLKHTILLKKLSCYGFSEHSTQLDESYLTNRKNRVRIGSVVSEWQETRRGCPQGSSFGPLLWNVYQNDLNYLLKNIKLLMYADDHQPYTTGEETKRLKEDLNVAIETVRNKDEFNIMTLPERMEKIQTNIDRKVINLQTN